MSKLDDGLKLGSLNTPVFSENAYQALPALLSKACRPFMQNETERDIALLSAVIALSACFPNVKGRYDNDELNANLYGIIIGPPASGKGVAKYGAMLVNGIQSYLEEGNVLAAGNYENQKAKLKAADGAAGTNKIVKPGNKSLLLPANISSTFLIKQIKENEKLGNVIFDSEADTLATVLGQEWGSGISELLRKAFHHEKTILGRSSENAIINIAEPKLSVLLTGTPGQLGGIIKSTEDGLFSRCMFYMFDDNPVWKNVAPDSSSETLSRYFNSLADETLAIQRTFLVDSFDYVLSQQQWERFNMAFKWLLEAAIAQYGIGVQGVIKRFGAIVFRLSMIFSILDYHENKMEGRTIQCSDRMLRLSLTVMRHLIIHSLEVFKKVESDRKAISRREQFIQNLPDGTFSTMEANKVGAALGLKERMIAYYLKEAVNNKILSHSHGEYVKV